MRRYLALALAVAMTSLVPVGSHAAAQPHRIYLLASSEDSTTWYSTDPGDPELQGDYACSMDPNSPSPECRGGAQLNREFQYFVDFYPRVHLDGPITWNAANPLSFHAEVDVLTAGSFEVEFVAASFGFTSESDPAVEVAPGIYEGSLRTGGPIAPDFVTTLGIQISSTTPVDGIVIGTQGKSWIDLITAINIRSVPELMAADTTSPVSELVTAERTYKFNDDEWTHRSFTGKLTPSTTHNFMATEKSQVVLAWLEGFVDPIVTRAAQGREIDPRAAVQFPKLALMRGNDVLVAHERTIGAMDVAAGDLKINVYADSLHGSIRNLLEGRSYTLHVLEIHGARTLREMEWLIPPARWFTFSSDTARTCPYPAEPIPQLGPTTTFRLDLDVQAETPNQEWTFFYELPGPGVFPCGEAGTEESYRITLDRTLLWYIGPTPQHDSTFVSAEDVVFKMSAAFTYDPV